MKRKCDSCGNIKEMTYSFNRDGWQGSWSNYKLQFCYECGKKIEEFIDSLSETMKKEGDE